VPASGGRGIAQWERSADQRGAFHRSAGCSGTPVAGKNQDNDDDEHDAKDAGWIRAPAAGIAPRGKRADQQQDKDDDEYGAKHGSGPSLTLGSPPQAASNWLMMVPAASRMASAGRNAVSKTR